MMNDKRNPEEIESAQEERVDAVRNEAFPDGTNKDEGLDLPVILSSGDLSVRLPYRKIADVSEIISGWQSEWNEGYPDYQEDAEPWRFRSPAFLPGNRLALLFEMEEEVYEGHVEAAHVLNRFRVPVYDLKKAEIVQRFAFHGQDMEVKTVLSTPDRKGIRAVVRVRGREEGRWTVLPMIPTDDEGQFGIGPYVKNVVQCGSGAIAVSYAHNDLDKEKVPVALWDTDGSGIAGKKDPDEMECSALLLDSDQNVWAHFMPSGRIVRLGDDEAVFRSDYQGFDAFGISSDCRLAAVSWQKGVCENRMYLMIRKGERFEAFGKLDFSHLPGRPDPLECSAYGSPVFDGSRFVFNKDGALYLFDLDRAAEILM